MGAEDIIKHIENRLNIKSGRNHRRWQVYPARRGMPAACGNAPMLRIGQTYHEHLTCDKVDKLLEEYGHCEVTFRIGPKTRSKADMGKKILTEHINVPGIDTLEVYRAHGGYEGLKKALALTPDETTKRVLTSGLRGRGGAGFPTGANGRSSTKNRTTHATSCCNADSEPAPSRTAT